MILARSGWVKSVSPAVVLVLAGCSGTGVPDGGLDAPAMDAPRDAGRLFDAPRFDTARTDVPAAPDVGPDGSALDAIDAAGSPGDAGVGPACPVGGGCTRSDGTGGDCCDGACIDRLSDDAHCGTCGHRCRPGMSCVEGECAYRSCERALIVGFSSRSTFVAQCVLSDGTPRGYCCEGACHPAADFTSDPANCGGCGFSCAPGQSCTEVDCRVGGPACGPSGPGTCPPDTSCWGGDGCMPQCAGRPDGTMCGLEYPRLGACCGGTCVDPMNDDSNCGACGNVCGPGTTCAYYGDCYPLPACSEPGMSGAWCVLPTGENGICCGTTCTDVSSDRQHCGSCGIACPNDATCVDLGDYGECATVLADGGFGGVDCAGAADCPAGTLCDPVYGRCVWSDCTGRPDGSACTSLPFTLAAPMCCGGVCVDALESPNCGACGVSCGTEACVNLSRWPVRAFVTCVPEVSPSPDCSRAGGCPATDECIGDVCVARTCVWSSELCRTTTGEVGVCRFGSSGTLACVRP